MWKWSCVRLLATSWTAAYQAPPSMGFSRQQYWSGVPLPSVIALARWTFVGKVMSLLFSMLSRLVIAFLPRSKCLLISRLQSPSAVILEPKKIKSLSCVWLLATPWTAAYQSPPSMGFSRQEYWSGVPLPSPWQNAYHMLIFSIRCALI